MATAKSTRAGKAHPRIPKSRRKPAILSKATADAIRAVRHRPSTDALRDIRRKLEVVMAVVCVSAAALRAQRADDDTEVALCLQHPSNRVLKLDQLGMIPTWMSVRDTFVLQLRQRVLEAALGLELPEQIAQPRVPDYLWATEKIFECLGSNPSTPVALNPAPSKKYFRISLFPAPPTVTALLYSAHGQPVIHRSPVPARSITPGNRRKGTRRDAPDAPIGFPAGGLHQSAVLQNSLATALNVASDFANNCSYAMRSIVWLR